MASWVTHLMIADRLLQKVDRLDRCSFCVGNIAPDCNIESDDWKTFTPPREVTHFMSGKHKTLEDCECFFNSEVMPHLSAKMAELSFFLGYYTHLVADAAFQTMIRDEVRVKAAWQRVLSNEHLCTLAKDMPQSFKSIKQLIPHEMLFHGISRLEAEYLRENPDSGYLTEILPLEVFPEYLDMLPKGAIVRKVKVMAAIPDASVGEYDFVSLSREEYFGFVDHALELSEKGIMRAFELRDTALTPSMA